MWLGILQDLPLSCRSDVTCIGKDWCKIYTELYTVEFLKDYSHGAFTLKYWCVVLCEWNHTS